MQSSYHLCQSLVSNKVTLWDLLQYVLFGCYGASEGPLRTFQSVVVPGQWNLSYCIHFNYSFPLSGMVLIPWVSHWTWKSGRKTDRITRFSTFGYCDFYNCNKIMYRKACARGFCFICTCNQALLSKFMIHRFSCCFTTVAWAFVKWII
jgi:hypothetical protein